MNEETVILKPTSPKLPVDVIVNYDGTTKAAVVDFWFKNSVIFE